jgi:tetratricopeptide (TPR) repeat protein
LALVLPLLPALKGYTRGDDAADARRHAQRASGLAASGKCRQAVAELDKALAILRDPALLFNRAECHRKLGDTDEALDDYRQFLSDLPKAPNRAEVERRIAELSGKSGGAGAPVPTSERAVRVAGPAPTAVAPRTEAPSSPAPRSPTETAIAPREVVAPPPAAVAEQSTPDSAPNPALVLTAPADTSSSSSQAADGGITTRPWFWITIAAVAVAAGVGTFVLLSRDSTSVPSSALGNYKF